MQRRAPLQRSVGTMTCRISSRSAQAFITQDFVSKLTDLPESARSALAQMTPATYIGNAAEQVSHLDARLHLLFCA